MITISNFTFFNLQIYSWILERPILNSVMRYSDNVWPIDSYVTGIVIMIIQTHHMMITHAHSNK